MSQTVKAMPSKLESGIDTVSRALKVLFVCHLLVYFQFLGALIDIHEGTVTECILLYRVFRAS